AGGQLPISISKTALDRAGNIYVIGTWIPFGWAAQPSLNTQNVYDSHDLVVSKIDPSGSIAYLTYLGGRGDNIAMGIAVDSSGNAYGAGYTTSPDFPLQHAIQSETSGFHNSPTGFVFKLDETGALAWSTYFGGSGTVLIGSTVNAIAADAAGNIYVTGTSNAANFPTTQGAYQTSGNVSDDAMSPAASAFVSKISPSGTVLYSTWLGGSQSHCEGVSSCIGYLRQ